MKTVSENACFGGVQGVYAHESAATGCEMTFGLFLPEEARAMEVPVIWYLSGLTCTHENAMTKAGAQAWAAEAGVALVFPDTSPRGDDVADDDAFDLGKGAVIRRAPVAPGARQVVAGPGGLLHVPHASGLGTFAPDPGATTIVIFEGALDLQFYRVIAVKPLQP